MYLYQLFEYAEINALDVAKQTSLKKEGLINKNHLLLTLRDGLEALS